MGGEGGGGTPTFHCLLSKKVGIHPAVKLCERPWGGGWTVGVGGATAWVGCRVDGEWEGIGLEFTAMTIWFGLKEPFLVMTKEQILSIFVLFMTMRMVSVVFHYLKILRTMKCVFYDQTF